MNRSFVYRTIMIYPLLLKDNPMQIGIVRDINDVSLIKKEFSSLTVEIGIGAVIKVYSKKYQYVHH